MSTWDELLGDLPEYMTEAVISTCHDMELGPDEVLMYAGDDDPAMLYVMQGEVSVIRGGVEIDRSGPGEVVGEMALFRGQPRVAEVRTTQPTRALLIDRTAYDALVLNNNPIVFRLERLILTQMGQRLRRLDALVARNAEGEVDPYAPPPRSFFAQLKDALLKRQPEPEVVEREIDPVAVLRGSRLFRGEPLALLQGLARFFEPFAWARGETLCDQGEAGDAIYLIAEGEAAVHVRTESGKVHTLGRVGPGAAVGMTSLVDGRPRMATVIATEQVDALELSHSAFNALVQEDGQLQSALRRAIIRAFADQIDEAGANLVALASPEVPPGVSAHVATELYN